MPPVYPRTRAAAAVLADNVLLLVTLRWFILLRCCCYDDGIGWDPRHVVGRWLVYTCTIHTPACCWLCLLAAAMPAPQPALYVTGDC